MSGYERQEASSGPFGSGATEWFITPNQDGSTSVLTVGHHTGCPGYMPCLCQPTKTSDRRCPIKETP